MGEVADPGIRWGTGSTIYYCVHCGSSLESAWQIDWSHPHPASYAAGRQLWRHSRTHQERCQGGNTIAAYR